MIRRRLHRGDSRDRVIVVFFIFFLELLLVKNLMIVMTKIMF